MTDIIHNTDRLFNKVSDLLKVAQNTVLQAVNTTMVSTYKEFGKGFSVTNIQQMRNFYLIYQKQQTLSAKFELSWSHYLKLMRIDDTEERKFYEIESIKNNWSIRELQRQYNSALYTRLALSRDKKKIKEPVRNYI